RAGRDHTEEGDEHVARALHRDGARPGGRRVGGRCQDVGGPAPFARGSPRGVAGAMAGRVRHRGTDAGRSGLTDPAGAAGAILMAGGILLPPARDVLERPPDGSADLIYVDPPFGTGQTRRLDTIRTGTGERTRRGFGERTYRYEVASSLAYR